MSFDFGDMLPKPEKVTISVPLIESLALWLDTRSRAVNMEKYSGIMQEYAKQLRHTLVPRSRTKVVCLCGSTRFKDAFIEANRNETIAGNIVLSVGMFGHQEGIDMDGPLKKMLDELHMRKIDMCDEVLVLNVDGYIGSSCKNEIAYATSLGKTIRYLE